MITVKNEEVWKILLPPLLFAHPSTYVFQHMAVVATICEGPLLHPQLLRTTDTGMSSPVRALLVETR